MLRYHEFAGPPGITTGAATAGAWRRRRWTPSTTAWSSATTIWQGHASHGCYFPLRFAINGKAYAGAEAPSRRSGQRVCHRKH
jgi:hypothetical protein